MQLIRKICLTLILLGFFLHGANAQTASISGIINHYASIESILQEENKRDSLLVHGLDPKFEKGDTVMVITGLALGRWICGWLCPFGLISDIFDRFSKRNLVPRTAWRGMAYVVLVLIVAAPLIMASAGGAAWLLHQGMVLGWDSMASHYLGEVGSRAMAGGGWSQLLWGIRVDYPQILLKEMQPALLPGRFHPSAQPFHAR